jgi:hypothetical protein
VLVLAASEYGARRTNIYIDVSIHSPLEWQFRRH